MATKTTLAAGFIIFRRTAKEIQYLFLQTSNAEFHWGPPKGYADPGEEALQTALRETEEESGISKDQMTIYPEFKSELNYQAWGKPKTVMYLLSEVKDPSVEVTISSEHQDWKWFNLLEALKTAKYDSLKQAIQEADDFIHAKLCKQKL